MTLTKTSQIKKKANFYLNNAYKLDSYLWQVYGNYSRAKEKAFDYCLELVNKYKGRNFRILGANTCTFSFGFIGFVPNENTGELEESFIYITRDYDRYIPLSLLND